MPMTLYNSVKSGNRHLLPCSQENGLEQNDLVPFVLNPSKRDI